MMAIISKLYPVFTTEIITTILIIPVNFTITNNDVLLVIIIFRLEYLCSSNNISGSKTEVSNLDMII